MKNKPEKQLAEYWQKRPHLVTRTEVFFPPSKYFPHCGDKEQAKIARKAA